MGGIKACFVVLYLPACHINISVRFDLIIIKLPFVWLDVSLWPVAQSQAHAALSRAWPSPGQGRSPCAVSLCGHRRPACAGLGLSSASGRPAPRAFPALLTREAPRAAGTGCIPKGPSGSSSANALRSQWSWWGVRPEGHPRELSEEGHKVTSLTSYQ